MKLSSPRIFSRSRNFPLLTLLCFQVSWLVALDSMAAKKPNDKVNNAEQKNEDSRNLDSDSAAKEVEAGEKAMSVEDYLSSLSSQPTKVWRRDPFFKVNPPFEVPQKEDPNKIDMSKPVLERYPSREYQVVAVLLGDQYPRALVKLPAGEKNQATKIVREKDRLGNKNGLIKKITMEGLTILEKIKSPLGFVESHEESLPIVISEGK